MAVTKKIFAVVSERNKIKLVLHNRLQLGGNLNKLMFVSV